MSAKLIPELCGSRFHPSLPQTASRDCPVQKRPPACPPTTSAGLLGGQNPGIACRRKMNSASDPRGIHPLPEMRGAGMWCPWVVPGDQNWHSTPCSEVRQILFPGILAELPPTGMTGTSSLVLSAYML